MKSVNPSNNQLLQEYRKHSDDEISEILESSHNSWLEWSNTPVRERADRLTKVSELLLKDLEDHARLITLEMGKPISQARAEIKKCASVCEYYVQNGPRFLKNEIIETEASKSFVSFEPLGVILGIMPWNFPYWQVFRFLAPTLTAGNGALLKHASNVTGCALAIEDLFAKAGYPKDLMRTLLMDHDQTERVIQDSRVQAVTLTGSEKAGMIVAAQCGKALKKTVMELGGSDPYIVLEDADLDSCVETAVSARLNNAGQSCIAAKRFIIHQDIHEKFHHKLKARLESVTLGDPLHEEAMIGPMAREDLRQELHRQVTDSIAQGAKCEMGGKIPEGPGYYYPVTILTNVQKGMRVYEEETFGPVYALIKANDEKDAIRIANDSEYGLGASLWTSDEKRAEEITTKIQSGSVFVNTQTVSNIHLPFGGIKKSGYGRELSHYGIKEFVNIKTVFIKTSE